MLQKNTLFTGTIRENMLWGNNNATDEEVKVLNIYPQENNADSRLYPDLTPEQVRQHFTSLPKVQVTYLDGQTETIQKSALLKAWMEGRNSKRR